MDFSRLTFRSRRIFSCLAALVIPLLSACDGSTAITSPGTSNSVVTQPGETSDSTQANGTSQVDGTTQASNGENNAETVPQTSELLTGVFVDSPVANLAYKTNTQSGLTDHRGLFTYHADELITFSIGGIQLPEVSAKAVITPVDLFDEGTVNHRGVVNVSRLLQTLDEDSDPANGISLDSWTHSIQSVEQIDFESTEFTASVNSLISTHSASPKSLVDGSDAIRHLVDTLVTSNIPVKIEDESEGIVLLDSNTNGIPDFFDWDDDGDGVYDAQDRFPLDATEQFDTDNDGLGNNVDQDDDNDGVADNADAFPLSENESKDTDNDGIGDRADTDDDNDGTKDFVDAFPLDASEQLDSDSDGVGNNADNDDDNDGYLDREDEFPYTSVEWRDTDDDGVGDNTDSDDDNDGVEDIVDAFPTDSAEFADNDGDGVGNNADTDDDGNGIPDDQDTNEGTGDNTPPNLTVPENMRLSNRVSAGASLGVSDAENNVVRISWTVVSGPADGDLAIITSESFTEATIQASVIGRYVIGVTATDGIDSTYRTFTVEVANNAPVVSAISIEPQLLTAAAYLEASHSPVEDADGDFVDLLYTWIVNGVELDYSSSYLPPNLVVRGDAVALRLDVSDGVHEVSVLSDEVVVANSPPAVQSVQIIPSQATTSDELTVSLYSLSDADGDDVEISYVWELNGQVLSDQTEITLPAGTAKYQDVVSVTAVISDSIDTFEAAPVSIEINDAPSVLDDESVPLVLDYGVQASFAAMFVDPDGTAVETVLVSAPEGLTYDSTTGMVSWTPTPLMLQSNETYHAYFGSSDIQVASIGLNVVDPDRETILARSGIEVPYASQPLDTGDFDGDGVIEVLSTTRGQSLFTLQLDGNEIIQDWMYPFGFGVEGEIRFAWVHGVDQSQMIVVTTRNVFLIKSRDEAPVSILELEQDVSTSRIADLDADGVDELVLVSTAGELTVRSTETWEHKWPALSLVSSGDNSFSSYALEIANVNSDPGLEIITSTGDVIDGATGASVWKHDSDFGSLIAVGDVDGDGDQDIVASSRWSGLTSYDVATQSSMWEYDLSDTCAVKTINVDDDLQDEIIHGGCQHGRIEIYDVATGTAVMQEFIDHQDFGSGFTSLTVADIDSDGFDELVFGTGIGTSGEDNMVFASIPSTGDTTPGLAINTDPSQLGSYYVAGWDTVTGGEDRAVFVIPDTDSGYDGQRVGVLSSSGDLTLSEEIASNWSHLTAAAVIDSNNDGVSEIFLATASTYTGRLVHLGLDDFTQIAEHTDAEEARSIALGTSADDSAKAVVASSDGKLRVYDIAGAVADWTSGGLSGGSLLGAITIATDDGFDIVAATSAEITAWTQNANGYTKTHTAAAACNLITTFKVEEVDHILCVEGGSYSSDSSTITVFNMQLIKQYETSVNYKITAIESTGGQQVLIGTSESIAGASYYSDEQVDQLHLFDPVVAAKVWSSMPLVGRINGIDLLTDPETGVRRIAVATDSAMYITP